MITLLITGVGGPLGQALIKAARASEIPTRIVGTDRHPLSIGFHWVDRAHVVASSAEPDAYVADVHRICSQEKVTLILPGSESELELLASASESIQNETGAAVVSSAPSVLRIGLDKCETCAFLEKTGRGFPAYAHLSDIAAVERLIERRGFPLIAKPCRGSGSRGLTKVRNCNDIDYLRSLAMDTVVQEYLTPDDEEYTVAVYTERDGRQAGSIALKRELIAGNTYRAWVDQHSAVLAEAEAVVRSLGAAGPCNVQLRLTSRGPVTFEINPRFSGTTAMRAHFGYNEVEMAMRDYALAAPIPKPLVRAGIALRFWDEVYLPAESLPRRKTARPPQPSLRVLGTSDAAEWLAVLRRSTQHDVYLLPAYHALAEERGEGKAHLFVYEDGDYMIALPLMVRDVAEVPGLNGTAGRWRDASSVYGYGGPVASHERFPAERIAAFHRSLGEAMRDLKIVGVFSRLHPLISQGALLDGCGVCHTGGQTVSIDLSLTPEEQRARFRATVKNRINRLQRQGVSCERDAGKRHLAEFVSIYHETMRRVGAHQTYFFGSEYFERLAEKLGPALQLFLVRLSGGEVIAGGLFTSCDGIVQYHLGGTRDAGLKLSPTALLFDRVRFWASEERARVFHLGGGVGSHSDSLFQFKAGFSDRRHEFATWRWIVAPEVYASLSAQRERWNDANGAEPLSREFFPAYRCATRPAEVSGLTSDRARIVEEEVGANG